MICPTCASENTIKKGLQYFKGVLQQRNRCKDCGVNFYHDPRGPSSVIHNSMQRKWVITTALNDTRTNMKMFDTLKTYCAIHNAELLIIPVKYQLMGVEEYRWDEELTDYFVDSNLILTDDLKLLAGVNISPTSANPLAGFDSISKGMSLIIPSPKLMMKTVAVNHIDKPAIIHTTGSLSYPNYTNSKAGEKATFNHSFSALIVEEDTDINSFHVRVLNSDETGSFYDIEYYYSGSSRSTVTSVPGIVLGDEHVHHIDPEVKSATFDNHDSICSVLRPEFLIRHDVLDFYAASHHHKNNFFLQYKKFQNGTNKVEAELYETIDYLIKTTPPGSKSVIVDSNHNNHLDVWLNTTEPKKEMWNSKLYYKLMYLKMEAIDNNIDENTFALWSKDARPSNNIIFVGDDESFKIFDIELGFHSDRGVNGSRGSTVQFSKLGHKTIIGHQHSPNIYEGAYCVGHSCVSKLEYNKGPSSWHHAHCVIYPNGKRQMIFIKNGKWRK